MFGVTKAAIRYHVNEKFRQAFLKKKHDQWIRNPAYRKHAYKLMTKRLKARRHSDKKFNKWTNHRSNHGDAEHRHIWMKKLVIACDLCGEIGKMVYQDGEAIIVHPNFTRQISSFKKG